jgi:hypothetical protein
VTREVTNKRSDQKENISRTFIFGHSEVNVLKISRIPENHYAE